MSMSDTRGDALGGKGKLVCPCAIESPRQTVPWASLNRDFGGRAGADERLRADRYLSSNVPPDGERTITYTVRYTW